jgi:hypothetical protein
MDMNMDIYMKVVYLVCIDFVSSVSSVHYFVILYFGSIMAINIELEFMATGEVRARWFYMTCKVDAPNLVVESK